MLFYYLNVVFLKKFSKYCDVSDLYLINIWQIYIFDNIDFSSDYSHLSSLRNIELLQANFLALDLKDLHGWVFQCAQILYRFLGMVVCAFSLWCNLRFWSLKKMFIAIIFPFLFSSRTAPAEKSWNFWYVKNITEILSHPLFSIENKNVDISWSNCLNIFSIAYLNILYCIEFFIWREPLATIWHVFICTPIHASLDVFKLYSTDTAPISASPFLPVYFSFAAFRFLHSLIQCPVAIMTHARSNVAFFEIFFILMLIGSKSNVFCSFFGSYSCFLNGESWNKICESPFVGLSWFSHTIKYLNDEDNKYFSNNHLIWNFLSRVCSWCARFSIFTM